MIVLRGEDMEIERRYFGRVGICGGESGIGDLDIGGSRSHPELSVPSFLILVGVCFLHEAGDRQVSRFIEIYYDGFSEEILCRGIVEAAMAAIGG